MVNLVNKEAKIEACPNLVRPMSKKQMKIQLDAFLFVNYGTPKSVIFPNIRNENFVLYNFQNYIGSTQKCPNWPKGMVSTPPT